MRTILLLYGIGTVVIVAVLFAASRWAGARGPWARLVRAYPAPPGTGGGALQYVAYVGALRYRGWVRVRAGDEGLDLALLLGAILGHAPVRIPWSDLSARPNVDLLGTDGVVLEARGAPGTPIRLFGRAAWLVQQRVDGNPTPAR